MQRECRKWLNTTHGFADHQWGYLNIDRKLFVEPFISGNYGSRLTEIKIDCFHDEPKFALLIVNRDEERRHTLVDAKGQKLEVQYKGRKDVSGDVLSDFRSILPELRRWASRLSEEFEYCRVDFYLTPNGPRFSEITHYPASGGRQMKPQEFELEMGRHWNINSE
ncbi:ATP-grasp fold amidoligase family protein [Salinibacter ruber]|uniref:ATP-grasp fold amidoligase family protein n=1 Tax=Salinibacter ruber TaxID=146919 RepID=UPI003C6E07FE